MINKLNSIEFKINANSNTYEYNGISVPRVTEILQTFNENDALMYWSNSLGFKRIKYKDSLNNSAYIGTKIHNGIEEYIRSKTVELDDNTKNYNSINNGIESFIEWYNDVSKDNKIEILSMEEKLSCQWFGGTYDCLLKINDMTYLVDFKSSNHISYKYFMQIAAYKYMLKTIKNIDLDGAIILQVDKNTIAYQEYILRFDVKEHLDFINHCSESFFALLYTYINIMHTKTLFAKLF